MFYSRSKLLMLVGALCFLASVAHGGVISVSGAVTLIDTPPGWALGQLESNQYIWAFYFQTGGVLSAPEQVPGPLPGTYPGLAGESFNFALVTYPAGTMYDLLILSFDPVGSTGATAEGSITFDGRLLYITDNELDAPIYGGIEGGDWVTISSDLRTLTVHMTAGPHLDQLFLAVEVPEPGALWMTAPALLLLAWRRRRVK